MARKERAPVSVPVLPIATGAIQKEGKKYKPNGKTYTLKEDYSVLPHLKPLLAGCLLIECNDGFFASEMDGYKLYYRLGPQIIDKIKHILV